MKTLSTLLIALLFFSQPVLAQNWAAKTNEIRIQTTWEDGLAIITWETEREVNTSHFLIEKTTDGRQYEILGTQKAGSSTFLKSTYAYEDAGEVSANTQYRVTLITMDGQATSSQVNSDFATTFAGKQ